MQEGAERFRDWHLVLSETDEHLVVSVGDLAGGHGGNPGLLLAEQQRQGAGDAVDEVEVVVVQQPGELCPALVGVGGLAAAALGAGDLEGGAVACFSGPGEEVAHVAGAAVAGVREHAAAAVHNATSAAKDAARDTVGKVRDKIGGDADPEAGPPPAPEPNRPS